MRCSPVRRRLQWIRSRPSLCLGWDSVEAGGGGVGTAVDAEWARRPEAPKVPGSRRTAKCSVPQGGSCISRCMLGCGRSPTTSITPAGFSIRRRDRRRCRRRTRPFGCRAAAWPRRAENTLLTKRTVAEALDDHRAGDQFHDLGAERKRPVGGFEKVPALGWMQVALEVAAKLPQRRVRLGTVNVYDRKLPKYLPLLFVSDTSEACLAVVCHVSVCAG
jgi:hypothetical protein